MQFFDISNSDTFSKVYSASKSRDICFVAFKEQRYIIQLEIVNKSMEMNTINVLRTYIHYNLAICIAMCSLFSLEMPKGLNLAF